MTLVIYLVAVAILVAIDQYTKVLALTHLQGQANIPIIKDVFELSYVENRGAAFGQFQNKIWFLVIVTIIVMGAIIYYYMKLPTDKRYNWLRVSLVLISAGAVGNLIDRIGRRFVVDFLYFKLINFPVFNVADCFVVVGTILLAILVLFVYKDEFDDLL